MKKIADLPVKYVIDSHGHDATGWEITFIKKSLMLPLQAREY